MKKIICWILGHKYGKLFSHSKYHVAVKCKRCGHIILQDKQTMLKVAFGIFDDND